MPSAPRPLGPSASSPICVGPAPLFLHICPRSLFLSVSDSFLACALLHVTVPALPPPCAAVADCRLGAFPCPLSTANGSALLLPILTVSHAGRARKYFDTYRPHAPFPSLFPPNSKLLPTPSLSFFYPILYRLSKSCIDTRRTPPATKPVVESDHN